MSDFKFKKVVVKVGSNVLTKTDGSLDEVVLGQLTAQLAFLKQNNIEVVLVSSGAVAAGRGLIEVLDKSDAISSRQVFAAVGQVKLLQNYYTLFNEHGINCAQVLVTKEDFRDRTHYLHMRNCFTALIQNNIIPIVNENDVISVTELMFTDNDELAGLIATMINAEVLIILSNVDGIYDGNPKLLDSKLINVVDRKLDLGKFIQSTKSEFGRGGMITKYSIATRVAANGITVKIGNGKKSNILIQLLQDYNFSVGTSFPGAKTISAAKKQLAFTESFAKGEIVINEGAAKAILSEQASSLLTVGIIEILGEFQSGDIAKITDNKGTVIGLGKVQYNSKKAKDLIGIRNQKPIVHYDYLYLY